MCFQILLNYRFQRTQPAQLMLGDARSCKSSTMGNHRFPLLLHHADLCICKDQRGDNSKGRETVLCSLSCNHEHFRNTTSAWAENNYANSWVMRTAAKLIRKKWRMGKYKSEKQWERVRCLKKDKTHMIYVPFLSSIIPLNWLNGKCIVFGLEIKNNLHIVSFMCRWILMYTWKQMRNM